MVRRKKSRLISEVERFVPGRANLLNKAASIPSFHEVLRHQSSRPMARPHSPAPVEKRPPVMVALPPLQFAEQPFNALPMRQRPKWRATVDEDGHFCFAVAL